MNGPAITAKLGLDTGDFQRGITKAQDALVGFGKGFAGALTVGAVTQAVQGILDFAGGIQDAADKLSVGVEELQELDYAFGQSGASASDVDKALTKLQQTTVDAASGNTKLLDTFNRLGIEFSDLKDLTPDALLMKIAASAGEAQDPSQRLSDILDVLGKSGGKLAAGLNGGVEALQNLRKEASKLTKEEIAALDDAGDRVSRFWNGLKVISAKGLNKVVENLSSNANFSSMSPSGAFNVSQPKPQAPQSTNAPEAQTAKEVAQIERKASEDERRAQSDKARLAAEQFFNEEDRKAKAEIAEQKRQDEKAAREEKIIEDLYAYEDELFHDYLDKWVAEKKKREADAQDEMMQAQFEAEQKRLNERADRREAFIDGKMAGPNARREARREEQRRARFGRQFDEREKLAERGGRAKADAKDMERKTDPEEVTQTFLRQLISSLGFVNLSGGGTKK